MPCMIRSFYRRFLHAGIRQHTSDVGDIVLMSLFNGSECFRGTVLCEHDLFLYKYITPL